MESLISLYIILIVCVNCELTKAPSDVYGVPGSTVILHCSTNLSVPVQWEFKRTNHEPDEPWALVYMGYPESDITPRYRNKNKYNVTVDPTRNEYNLMIYNLQADDAGTYRCIDDYGFGGHKHDDGIPHHEYRAEVSIIEKNLVCSQCIDGSYVNQTSFNLKENYIIKLICSHSCVGRSCPTRKLLWSMFIEESGFEKIHYRPNSVTVERKSGVSTTVKSEIEINSTVIIEHSHIRCSLSENMNEASLSAHLANSSRSGPTIMWTSVIIMRSMVWTSGRQTHLLVEANHSYKPIWFIIIGLLFGVVTILVVIQCGVVRMIKKSGYAVTYQTIRKIYKNKIKLIDRPTTNTSTDSELQALNDKSDDARRCQKSAESIGYNKNDRVVTLEDLRIVSKYIPKHWRLVGRHLGISDTKLDVLDVNYRYDCVTEIAYQMLRDWQLNIGDNATKQKLIDALGEAGFDDAVNLGENAHSDTRTSYLADDFANFISGNNLQKKIKLEKEIMGITVVDDNIYLIDVGGEDQSKIYVYNLNTLKAETGISIPNMTRPLGLAGSSYNQELYITGDKMNLIHKVNLNNKEVDSFQVKYVYPRGLSITQEHSLLVTIWGKSDRILEYTRTGQMLQDIELGEDFTQAWQALQWSEDELIFCHGWHGSFLNRLCVINFNSEGEAVKIYGKEKGHGKDELNGPCSLTIDSKKDVLFLADYTNRRVLIFSRKLSLLGQLMTHEDLAGPSRVFFDEVSNTLIVGDASGHVLVISAND